MRVIDVSLHVLDLPCLYEKTLISTIFAHEVVKFQFALNSFTIKQYHRFIFNILIVQKVCKALVYVVCYTIKKLFKNLYLTQHTPQFPTCAISN